MQLSYAMRKFTIIIFINTLCSHCPEIHRLLCLTIRSYGHHSSPSESVKVFTRPSESVRVRSGMSAPSDWLDVIRTQYHYEKINSLVISSQPNLMTTSKTPPKSPIIKV